MFEDLAYDERRGHPGNIGGIQNESAPISAAYRSARTALSHPSHALGGAAAGSPAGGGAAAASSCLVAIIYNQAKEVGVAMVEFPSMTIVTTQFADGATNAKLHTLLFARNPVEILLPDNTVEEPLTRYLVAQYRDEVTFTSVPRRYFNAQDGEARLKELSSTHFERQTENYLFAAAAGALIAYVEALSGPIWQPRAARIRWETPEHFSEVPRSTARALHILRPGGGAGLCRGGKSTKDTWGTAAVQDDRSAADEDLHTVPLIDALPRTRTVMGQRLLRRSILQPLRDPTSISQRLDTVQWLAGNERRSHRLKEVLSGLSCCDVERVVASIAQPPRSGSDDECQYIIKSLLHFWDVLETLVTLRTRLGEDILPLSDNNANHPQDAPNLINELVASLHDCHLEDLIELMKEHMDAGVRHRSRGGVDVRYASGIALGNPAAWGAQVPPGGGSTQSGRRRKASARSSADKAIDMTCACYAVKSESVDLANTRSNLNESIQAIVVYRDELANKCHMPSLRLETDKTNFFSLSYSSEEHSRAEMVRIFIHQYAGGQHYDLVGQSLREAAARQRERLGHQDIGDETGDGDGESYEDGYDDDDGGEDPHTNPLPGDRSGRPTRRKVRVRCRTEKLDSLCRGAMQLRSKVLRDEIKCAQTLLEALRERIGSLQVLVEAVSLLDMLLSFATYSAMHQCTRPHFVTATPTGEPLGGEESSHCDVRLEQFRHPSQRAATANARRGRGGVVVANTLLWPGNSPIIILSGPNAGGKTTLLRIVGQLWTLAQCGCMIPAAKAQLFIADRIISHMLCDEPPTVAAAAQQRELIELGPIVREATAQSLVLMDELGRSMPFTQGFSLAWTTIMWLLDQRRARAIFVTHFEAVTKIATSIAGVMNMHFALDVKRQLFTNGGGSTTVVYSSSHVLGPGVDEAAAYGLRVAASSGVDPEVVEFAERLYKQRAGATAELINGAREASPEVEKASPSSGRAHPQQAAAVQPPPPLFRHRSQQRAKTGTFGLAAAGSSPPAGRPSAGRPRGRSRVRDEADVEVDGDGLDYTPMTPRQRARSESTSPLQDPR